MASPGTRPSSKCPIGNAASRRKRWGASISAMVTRAPDAFRPFGTEPNEPGQGRRRKRRDQTPTDTTGGTHAMTDETKNEGEGSRTAAREYNEKTREFTETKDVEAKAREAKAAIESDQSEELAKAEEEGKDKAADSGSGVVSKQ